MKPKTTENDDSSKSSDQYIINLMHTIESLNSMVTGLSGELAALRKQKAEDDFERKRLMAMIESKDQDIRNLTGQMGQMLTDMSCLMKALEDKSHQLANRNRGQFDSKNKAKTARRVDDYV